MQALFLMITVTVLLAVLLADGATRPRSAHARPAMTLPSLADRRAERADVGPGRRTGDAEAGSAGTSGERSLRNRRR